MRILLDEDLPRRLGALLVGHEVATVQRNGWAGIKNGRLLSLAGASFDVFLTALPIAVLVVVAMSNRIEQLEPLVPAILRALRDIQPRTLRTVRA